MTKGNASTNIQRMGAIQLIIFERLATTKRIVHAFLRRSVHLYGAYRQCKVTAS
jgi:hypothetical protein